MQFLAIEIPFHPAIIESFGNLTWHGLFSALGVMLVIVMASNPIRKIAMQYELSASTVSTLSIVGLIGGVIGARAVHVIDSWDFYSNDFIAVFYIWNGGIGLLGGILGAFIALLIYFRVKKVNANAAGSIFDALAIPGLLGQTLGRVGDLINGEHCATGTDLPWGFIYTNSASPGYQCIGRNPEAFPGSPDPAMTAVHPATEYEMVWNLIGVGLIYLLRNRIQPPGAIAAFYLLWYATGRFLIQWIRLDPVYFLNLQEAHIISLVMIALTLWYLISKARWVGKSNGGGVVKRGKARR